LLPRFGVDRLLVLLARHLAEAGHEVGFVCLRCNEAMLLPISPDVTEIPIPEGLNMEGTETATTAAMFQRWQQHQPDAVVIGGWPFFELAARSATFNVPSIFIDAGAVAQDALSEPQLTIQRELRRIRQLALPSIDRVLPISDFIRQTQSVPDRGSDVGVKTVLLGADHMPLGTFGGDQQTGCSRDLVRRLEAKVSRGERLLLALGRFEASGYKNSSAVYEVFRMVLNHVPVSRLLLLDARQDCNVPKDLAPSVELLGSPDDLTLQQVMRLCTAGISTSLWEGFNLPIAEMQWLDRPTVAFSLGAHPEVVAEPGLLCDDSKEMATKLVALLRGDRTSELSTRFAAFRERRQWKFTLEAWEHAILDAVLRRTATVEGADDWRPQSRIILVDVTNASLDPANPGVIRVVRRLCSKLQHDDRLELVFAAWSRDRGEYIFLDQTRRSFLEGYGGPRDGLGLLASWKGDMTPEHLLARIRTRSTRSPVLFLPEVMFDGQAEARANWGRSREFKCASILYDLIPISHSELCDSSVSAGFPSYLQALGHLDAVWSISDFTLGEFRRYLTSCKQNPPSSLEAIHLPGQFGERPRSQQDTSTDTSTSQNHETRMLFVSTLEPRKNHLRLLQAFEMLHERRPDLRLRLVLIGNRYAGALEITEAVEAAARRNPEIEWLGVVDDARAAEEFANCSFTVYPSMVEGYGLPILESLWMGRPCLTHNGGVMQELAAPGGCITADMTDPTEIMLALERMSTDQPMLTRLRAEAFERRIATWQDYADAIANRLYAL
jgi:glycosyltransferase involved in cell wall biosynthesis